MKHIFILSCIIILNISICLAQTETIHKESPSYSSLNVGVISALPGQNGINVGFNVGLDLGFHNEWYLHLGTMRRKRELESFAFGHLSANKLVRLENYSLMFGQKEYLPNDLYLYYSFGFSAGRGNYRGEIIDTVGSFFSYYVFEYDTFSYIGVPVNIGIIFPPNPIGVSIELFVNIHKHADYGIMFKFHLGMIKQRKKPYNDL